MRSNPRRQSPSPMRSRKVLNLIPSSRAIRMLSRQMSRKDLKRHYLAKRPPTPVGNLVSRALAEKASEGADADVVAGGVVVVAAASKRLPRLSVQRLRRELFLPCRPKK